jgi:hypothetical protein
MEAGGLASGMRTDRLAPELAGECGRALRGFVPLVCKIIHPAPPPGGTLASPGAMRRAA